VKARHTKDKSRSYERKSMKKNERTKGMHELRIIIIMHVNKLANTKHNKTNVRNTTTTNKQE
jgi:phosphopantetheine adenylyltransferase